MEQKKILFELLNRIEDDIPWRVIDWSKVFYVHTSDLRVCGFPFSIGGDLQSILP